MMHPTVSSAELGEDTALSSFFYRVTFQTRSTEVEKELSRGERLRRKVPSSRSREKAWGPHGQKQNVC